MFTCSACPKENVSGARGSFRLGLCAARSIGLAALLLALTAAPAWAQTVYTWTGSVSSDFTNSANWSGGQVAPTNNYPNALNARITVSNGSNYPLIYTSSQGYTLYASTGRSLFIGTIGANGSMEIQGGTFESRAAASDGLANVATGSLTINGGSYIFTSGYQVFLVVFGGGGTGTLTIDSGSFTVTTLQYGDSSSQTGTGTVRLNGGTLSVRTIQDIGAAGLTSNFYFNGGTLQARADTTTFLNNLDNAYISTGGALIDTQSYSVTIPVVLKTDPALGSSPDGGLKKIGSGTLTLSGSSANTFTGATTVQEGRLHLNKSANVNAIGGNLVISGGQVTFGNSDQLPDTATVTISSGVFNGTGAASGQRNDHSETIAALTATGGVFNTGVTSNWTVSTGSFTGGTGNTIFVGNSGAVISFGTLTVTNMTATAGGTTDTPNSFTLYGGNTSRQSTLLVGSGGLTLNNSAINLRRGGSGALGSRLILDGNVTTTGTSASSIKEDTAGGTTGAIAVELSSTAGTVTRTFNIGGGGADLTISIPITNGAATTAGITKTGAGMLTLSGNMANTFTGTTTVQEGRLHLNKSANVNAIGGNLVISGGQVTFGANDQLPNSATVNMSAGSLNGTDVDTYIRHDHTETIASLTMSGGLFQTGLRSNWTITGASFTGGDTTKTRVRVNSGAQISLNSLTLTNMSDTTFDGNYNYFFLFGNSPTQTTLTVGSGGLTLSSSAINLRKGSDSGTSGSRLVLNGNVTTSGSSACFIREDTTGNPNQGAVAVELSSTAGTVTRTFNIGGGGADLTISIPIANGAATTAGITKTGPGTLILSGANTYTGLTIINEGTVRLGSGSALGASGSTDNRTEIAASGTLDLNGQSIPSEQISVAGTITNTGTDQTNALRYVSLSGNATFTGTGRWDIRGSASGALDGTLNLAGYTATKTGTNTLGIVDTTITGPGGITVNQGTLILARSSWTSGTLTANSGTTVYFSSNTGTYSYQMSMVANGATIRSDAADTTVASAITLTGANTVQVDNYSLTLTGSISGTGSLTKTNSGTLVLSGANSYSGQTTVSAGVLRISSATALGAADGTSSTGTTVSSGARLELAGGITVTGEALTIAGPGGNNIGALQSASGDNTWAGPITLAATDTRIGANGSGQVLRVTGPIGDGGNGYNLLVRNADGGGETILSGQNTYGGATRVFVGVLKIDGGDDRLPTSSPLQIGNTSNVGSATFDLNGRNQQVAGLVSEGTTMPMTVTNSSATSSTLTIQNSTDYTYSGVITGNLSLVKQGSATQTLSGANTYTGVTRVREGTLKIDGGNNRLPTATVLYIGNSTNTGSATFDLNGRNQQVAGLVSEGTSMPMTVTNTSATASTLTIQHTSTYTYAGTISGNLSVVKQGSGTQVFSGNNSYTGTTTVSAGVLRITSPTALGAADGTSSTGTTVSSGARLELAGGITVSGEALSIAGDGGNYVGALQSASGTNTWAGPILLAANDSRIGANGSGQVLRVSGVIDDGPNTFNLLVRNADGGGETILSGQNTYGGATRVFVGVLKIDSGDNRLPTGSPLQIGNPSNVGSATFNLNGRNQQVAGLVSEGTTMSMTVTNSSATSSTLTIQNTTDYTYSGVITGNLSLVKQGSATQTLSGANTYTGTTDVLGGTLALVRTGSNNNIPNSSAIRVGAGAALNVTGLAGSLLRLASGQTLQGNGTVQGNVEAPAGSFLAAGMSPGKLTITGNYTQGGTLVVELAGYQQGGTQELPGQWQTNGYDWVSVGGSAVLDGYVDIRLLAGFRPQSGDVFNVLTAAGGITDQGLDLIWQSGSLLPSQYWTYRIIAGQGSEQILQLQLGVPEPASMVLLVIGAAALLLARHLLTRKKPISASDR
ncbi:MAG: autotransporter-associated beta strand repeat-containing protein [Thermoguttaceae bacterium]|nr:autotransporter-associated beta strand repeat-containing protein [Thermoguttaceae bacterium]MDW8036624.1 autotransporter-associated beta strand repeat-containing protein [Thermoguttaceae bacterium]